ncbi:hypothetical protein EDD68_10671 [Melghiribacillus thermohalophilus]|uniref:Uncharacterized protein n=1 Tax=Melghiribacillus thermohalophilus TaxID=1324956 RepID=A0A4R3N5R6_9BACI|nr:hypothetical protein [Melghiribacillus thermohalophilus]TCT23661.1 hypothetical protein EDD68_10671 [Melghiribacillus thermohalophilus]
MTKHLSEETIIDFIEKELNEQKANQVYAHLQSCESCKEAFDYWKDLLNADLVVPDSHKDQLWRKIHSTLLKKHTRSYTWIHRGLTAAVVSVLFFVIGYSIGHQNLQKTPSNSARTEQGTFVIDQETEIYDLIKTNTGSNHGYAWYNPVNKEMIVYIQDSTRHSNQPYYLEIHTNHATINSKPVLPENGKVQLYIKDRQLEQFYRIILKRMTEEHQESYDFRFIPATNHTLSP